MPVTPEGSCRCGTVSFTVASHTPCPYQRNFCRLCGTILWVYDDQCPELLNPFAYCIDSDLLEPPSRTLVLLDSKAPRVQPDIREDDESFGRYPEKSIEEWHKAHGVWVV